MTAAPEPSFASERAGPSALALLRDRFGHGTFRPGQAEIIDAVLRGQDALGVMPTGSGKSIGYALPSLILAAPVLVVSPLIALMKDQVDQLKRKGIAADYVNSTVAPAIQRQRIEAFKTGVLRLLFVAPERFRSERFMAALAGFRPGLFAVDEAHCISEWGHDFRPDYLRLKDAANQLGRPPILALTATATRAVREHVIENLGLTKPLVLVRGFERPNLDFEVVRCTSKQDKLDRLIAIARAGKRGIVYAATRKSVEEVASELKRSGLDVAPYHAGMQDTFRHAVSERFSTSKLSIVVATNAFGMGIDRPDLRFVVHYEVPGAIEAYTQEAGRAGRDGEPARCVLLYSAQDARLQRFFIDTGYPSEATLEQTLVRIERACRSAPTLAEDQIATFVPAAQHPREVDSALRVLAEAGCIARLVDGETRTKHVRFLEHRPIDHMGLKRRADREHQRLADMLDYAERGGCHRARLVDYFAGTTASEPCGACAGCRSSEKRRETTEEEADVARTVLSLVSDLNGRYGRKKLIGILTGSRSKDLLEARLERLPHYGRLRHLQVAFVELLFQECIDQSLLEIEGGKYPVITLGYRGRETLRGREPIRLACFDSIRVRK